MKMIVLHLILMLSLACSNTDSSDGSTTGGEPAAVTTVYMVRHAEKEAGDDPVLTDAGQKRAERLADRLSEVSLAAVYSTDTRRTRATAQPTAADQQLQIISYDGGHLSGLADRLRGDAYRGRSVLVIGHSNTVPALANLLLGQRQLTDFDDDDYGNLLIVTLREGGGARVQRKRY